MSEKNTNIHAHHRQRLKNRFNKYGYSSFESHNMLELLLFYGIPYKDTNPIAHNLIRRFGSMYEALKAPVEELCEVSGVGEYVANYLHFMNFCSDIAVRQCLTNERKTERYCTTDEVGRMLVSALSGMSGGIYMTLFNNNMEVIEHVSLSPENTTVYCLDRKAMLNKIIEADASSIVIAQYKPNGVAVPMFEEMNAVWDMKNDFLSSGICIAEFFIVTANDYTAVLGKYFPSRSSAGTTDGIALVANAGLDEVTDAKSESIVTLDSHALYDSEYNSEQLLAKLLSYAMRNGYEEASHSLIGKYGSLYEVLCLDKSILASEGLNENVCTLLRLTLSLKKYLAEKMMTDGLLLTDKSNVLMLLALMFLGDKKESFVLITFDSENKFTALHRLGAGSVNSVSIANRMALEIALQSGASHVVFAHNHPMGMTQPSHADITASESLHSAMKNANIELAHNYIISNGKYTEI